MFNLILKWIDYIFFSYSRKGETLLSYAEVAKENQRNSTPSHVSLFYCYNGESVIFYAEEISTSYSEQVNSGER